MQGNSVLQTHQDLCTYELRDSGNVHRTCTGSSQIGSQHSGKWTRSPFLTKGLSTKGNQLSSIQCLSFGYTNHTLGQAGPCPGILRRHRTLVLLWAFSFILFCFGGCLFVCFRVLFVLGSFFCLISLLPVVLIFVFLFLGFLLFHFCFLLEFF